MGGDEFVAIKTNVADRAEADAFGARLGALVAAHHCPAAGDVPVGASVGASLFPDDGRDRDLLLSRADMAMYARKSASRTREDGPQTLAAVAGRPG